MSVPQVIHQSVTGLMDQYRAAHEARTKVHAIMNAQEVQCQDVTLAVVTRREGKLQKVPPHGYASSSTSLTCMSGPHRRQLLMFLHCVQVQAQCTAERHEASEQLACARVDAHALLCKNYLLTLRTDDALEEVGLLTPEQLAHACQPSTATLQLAQQWQQGSVSKTTEHSTDWRLVQLLLACQRRVAHDMPAALPVFVDKLLQRNVRGQLPSLRVWSCSRAEAFLTRSGAM
jgi:hypothetical protein